MNEKLAEQIMRTELGDLNSRLSKIEGRKEERNTSNDANYYAQSAEALRSKMGFKGQLAASMMQMSPALIYKYQNQLSSAIGEHVSEALQGPLQTMVSTLSGTTGAVLQAIRPSTAKRIEQSKAIQSTQNERGFMSNATMGIGGAAGNLKRLLLTLNAGKSLMVGGNPLNTVMNPFMMGLAATQFAGSMLKAKALKRITAQRKPAGETEKSFVGNLDTTLAMMTAQGQITPADQLKIAYMKGTTSILAAIYDEMEYQHDEKEKSGAAVDSSSSFGLDEQKNPFIKGINALENGINKLLLQFDPVTQLVNYFVGGKTPRQALEELESTRGLNSKEREQLRTEARSKGINVQEARLMNSDINNLVSSGSYEERMYSLGIIQAKLLKLIASENMTMRKTMVSDNLYRDEESDKEPGLFSDIFGRAKSAITNIPGFNALGSLLSLPFTIGGKLNNSLGNISDKVQQYLLGGEYKKYQDQDILNRDLGYDKTLDQRYKEFVAGGLPNKLEEQRIILSELLEVQEESLKSQLTHYKLQDDSLTKGKSRDYYSTFKAYDPKYRKTDSDVWDEVQGRYLLPSEADKAEDYRSQHREDTRANAFMNSPIGRMMWLSDKIKGKKRSDRGRHKEFSRLFNTAAQYGLTGGEYVFGEDLEKYATEEAKASRMPNKKAYQLYSRKAADMFKEHELTLSGKTSKALEGAGLGVGGSLLGSLLSGTIPGGPGLSLLLTALGMTAGGGGFIAGEMEQNRNIIRKRFQQHGRHAYSHGINSYKEEVKEQKPLLASGINNANKLESGLFDTGILPNTTPPGSPSPNKPIDSLLSDVSSISSNFNTLLQLIRSLEDDVLIVNGLPPVHDKSKHGKIPEKSIIINGKPVYLIDTPTPTGGGSIVNPDKIVKKVKGRKIIPLSDAAAVGYKGVVKLGTHPKPEHLDKGQLIKVGEEGEEALHIRPSSSGVKFNIYDHKTTKGLKSRLRHGAAKGAFGQVGFENEEDYVTAGKYGVLKSILDINMDKRKDENKQPGTRSKSLLHGLAGSAGGMLLGLLTGNPLTTALGLGASTFTGNYLGEGIDKELKLQKELFEKAEEAKAKKNPDYIPQKWEKDTPGNASNKEKMQIMMDNLGRSGIHHKIGMAAGGIGGLLGMMLMGPLGGMLGAGLGLGASKLYGYFQTRKYKQLVKDQTNAQNKEKEKKELEAKKERARKEFATLKRSHKIMRIADMTYEDWMIKEYLKQKVENKGFSLSGLSLGSKVGISALAGGKLALLLGGGLLKGLGLIGAGLSGAGISAGTGVLGTLGSLGGGMLGMSTLVPLLMAGGLGYLAYKWHKKRESKALQDKKSGFKRDLIQKIITGEDLSEMYGTNYKHGENRGRFSDEQLIGIYKVLSKIEKDRDDGISEKFYKRQPMHKQVFDRMGTRGLEFREKGGPVKKGRPYIVGEKRPELFIPHKDGEIKNSVEFNPSNGPLNIIIEILKGVSGQIEDISTVLHHAPIFGPITSLVKLPLALFALADKGANVIGNIFRDGIEKGKLVLSMLSGIKDIDFTKIKEWFGDKFNFSFLAGLKDIKLGDIKGWIKDKITSISWLPNTDKIKEWIKGFKFPKMSFIPSFDKIKEYLSNLKLPKMDFLSNIKWSNIKGLFTSSFDKYLKTPFNSLASAISSIAKTIKSEEFKKTIKEKFTNMTGAIGRGLGKVANVGKTVYGDMKAGVSKVYEDIKSVGKKAFDSVTFKGAREKLKTMFGFKDPEADITKREFTSEEDWRSEVIFWLEKIHMRLGRLPKMNPLKAVGSIAMGTAGIVGGIGKGIGSLFKKGEKHSSESTMTTELKEIDSRTKEKREASFESQVVSGINRIVDELAEMNGKKKEDKKESKDKGIIGTIFDFLFGKVSGWLVAAGGAVLSTLPKLLWAAIKTTIKTGSSILGRAATVIGKAGGGFAAKWLMPVGIFLGAFDIISDFMSGYKEDGISGGLSKALFGDSTGGLLNALTTGGKWGAIGAGIGAGVGAIFGGIGAIPGAVAGWAIGSGVGALVGLIGTDNIAAAARWLQDYVGGGVVADWLNVPKDSFAYKFAKSTPIPLLGGVIGIMVGGTIDAIASIFSKKFWTKLSDTVSDYAWEVWDRIRHPFATDEERQERRNTREKERETEQNKSASDKVQPSIPNSSDKPVEARAVGGPIQKGNPYLVGEKGPELITPHSDGMVIPNHTLQSLITQLKPLMDIEKPDSFELWKRNFLSGDNIAKQFDWRIGSFAYKASIAGGTQAPFIGSLFGGVIGFIIDELQKVLDKEKFNKSKIDIGNALLGKNDLDDKELDDKYGTPIIGGMRKFFDKRKLQNTVSSLQYDLNDERIRSKMTPEQIQSHQDKISNAQSELGRIKGYEDRQSEKSASNTATSSSVSSKDYTDPNGTKDNNVGNIRAGKGFRTYQTPESGVADAARLLGTDRYNNKSLYEIGKVWAPSSDGNNPGQWAETIGKIAKVDPNQKLNMKDPDTLKRVISGIARMEKSKNVASRFTSDVISRGVDQHLSGNTSQSASDVASSSSTSSQDLSQQKQLSQNESDGSTPGQQSASDAQQPSSGKIDSSGYNAPPGAHIDKVNPDFLSRFSAATAEYARQTGKTVQVTDGWRSYDQQVKTKQSKGKLAATPGRSMHGYGFAIDANSKDLTAMDQMGLLAKYGLHRPMGYEPWHVEPIGVDKKSLYASGPSGKQDGASYSAALTGGKINSQLASNDSKSLNTNSASQSSSVNPAQGATSPNDLPKANDYNNQDPMNLASAKTDNDNMKLASAQTSQTPEGDETATPASMGGTNNIIVAQNGQSSRPVQDQASKDSSFNQIGDINNIVMTMFNSAGSTLQDRAKNHPYGSKMPQSFTSSATA